MYPAYNLPVWLTDEQLLRDEAVVFGLSEARPDEKIASIRLAFAALTAPLEKQIEQHQETISNLNLLLDRNENQPTHHAMLGIRPGFGGWPVVTCLLGLLTSLALCVGTYAGTLPLANPQLSLLVAALAGLSGCVATLLICQAIYRKSLTNKAMVRSEADEVRKQEASLTAERQHQKTLAVNQLYQAEAALNQQNAHRDQLIHLFESEFDLARSLRHQVRDRYVDL